MARSFALALLANTFFASITIPGVVAESPAPKKYDFIVVGGGPAGLVVARRLSEDPSIKVLVVEAGPLDQHEDFVDVPALSLGAVGTKYDWNMTYQASDHVAGRAIGIPQGHVVGGGTILNAMIWQRGTKRDYANWEALGASDFGWDGLLEHFMQSEIFVGPNSEISSQYDITVDWSVHDQDASSDGDHGVFATYSPWFYPSVQYFLNASAELGVPEIGEPGAGIASGVMFQPRSQDPVEATRSSARVGYYDPIADRKNVDWVFEHTVLKLLFDEESTGRVTGIEFSACPDCEVHTASAARDVVLAAGAIGTPALLQRSGVGPANVLGRAGVDVRVENPNVGVGLTDHYFVSTIFNISNIRTALDLSTDPAYASEAQEQYDQLRTGPLSTVGADIIFFLATEQYASSPGRLAEIAQAAASQDPLDFVDDDWSDEFKAGYQKQHALLVDHLASGDGTTLEVIPNDQAGVLVNIAPFSRGSVRVASADPWAHPKVDSGFLRNPVDAALLVEAVKWARRLYATDALAALEPAPVSPAPGAVNTNDEIEAWVRSSGSTIFHPSASCSMGPREEGGAVDPETLLVYGLENVRVVDSSVMPMIMAGHTQATVYGVAEKAATIIKAGLKGGA